MTRFFSIAFIREIFAFGVVGTIGFVVDTSVLYLTKGHFGLFYGRATSFVCAAFTTWLINRAWTFKSKRSSLDAKSEFAVYFLLMLMGGAVNYSAYYFTISKYPLAASHPIIGVAAGSIAGMFVNLMSSRMILFKHRDRSIQAADVPLHAEIG
ncbi:GtrA family protein [Paraburkholderia phymatum]|uniref:GtrA family protein n=1 Tax=Paraburkholderia phymatum (strain DSM 17167 / CIP 108236 / LMG 21445 / STM815) TaxID=391038 RepID=B2JFA1_PARP8|nr:GtrA family protein [Paraburkholderia phymatum]ACC71469.1 GtrA family protein [Paraburkholderia phymatum STM815]